MWDPLIHPFSGSSVPFDTPSRMHPLRGPASLLEHRLLSTPFGAQPPRWHIAWCLALIAFVTAQAHRSQILSSLGFPFRASPQGFQKASAKDNFHTLIKNVSFPSPTDVGSHNASPNNNNKKNEQQKLFFSLTSSF